MKATLFMATSADGFIARKDGSEDFLPHKGREEMIRFVGQFGHIIWGRKTYEEVRSWNGNFLDDLEDYPIIVISQQNISFSEPNVKVCFSPMGALTLVEELGYKKAFLTGGAGINTAFAKLHLIEEMYINFNPVIIGEGISLFSEAIELDLSLKEIKKLTSDIVQLHYIVKET